MASNVPGPGSSHGLQTGAKEDGARDRAGEKLQCPSKGSVQEAGYPQRRYSNRGYPALEMMNTCRVSFRNKTEIYFPVTG